MFISLSVENFRSIKEKVVFSLAATNGKNHLAEHVYQTDDMPNGALRSAGIYGANASGKSNMLMVFEALKFIISESGDLKDGRKIPCYEPYRLSESSKRAPITIEAEFYTPDNMRFSYRVKYNKDCILEESLDFYPSRVKANLFTRVESDTWETIKFGGLYKGGAKKIAFFKNNSYISKAGDNASSPEIIRKVFNFVSNNVRHVGLNEKIRISTFGDREKVVANTAKVLCMFDTGIKSISIKESDSEFPISLSEDMPQEIKDMLIDEYKYNYLFSHQTEDGGSTDFPLNRESEGTQKLFEIIPLLSSAFERRQIIIMDELDSSLHPHIADLIIRLFNDDSVNVHGSQIIFTTHNMHLMAPEKMRRDQIWFAEKNKGKTIVYSLDSFDKKKVKTSTPYSSWYDEGRFGGVPEINYSEISSFFSKRDYISEADFNSLFPAGKEGN
ncbi:AAA family ATPase [Pectobacterium actinidiae]|uniref:AAA family ATPase n=1 Tax=Pectobacterium actinidiae TaxID=1507808 RepID=UPI00404078E9